MRRLALAALLLALALPAQAQQIQPIPDEIGDFLPCDAGSDGLMQIALDPAGEQDCTVGGGTEAPHPCCCDGSTFTWVVCGDGLGDHVAGQDLDMVDNDVVWSGAQVRLLHIGSAGGQMVVEALTSDPPDVPCVDDGRRTVPCGDTQFCIDDDCNEGQGDCDSNTWGNIRCLTGMICRLNRGRLHDMEDGDDVCLPSDYWCAASCSTETPCRAGQGDCGGSDANCRSGLVCDVDAGGSWGCTVLADVCRQPDSVCDVGCEEEAAPVCQEGEGDCQNSADCDTGLTCEPTGTYHGCFPTTNICEPT